MLNLIFPIGNFGRWGFDLRVCWSNVPLADCSPLGRALMAFKGADC